MRIFLLSGLILFASFRLEASMQTGGDSCRFQHFTGIQANGLLRQLLSFGNNAQTVTNPFLLNYSLNNKNSGWGFHVGAGYVFADVADNDGITDRKTYINNFSGRVGLDKMFTLNSRWQTGVSIDGLYFLDDNKTETTITNFDTVRTITNINSTRLGGGLRSYLRFGITEHILLGTEASIYFRSGTDKVSNEVIQQIAFGGGSFSSKSETKQKLSNVDISVPVVLYLIIAF
jgi:hypothetical protein